MPKISKESVESQEYGGVEVHEGETASKATDEAVRKYMEENA
jgi:hypothetical protein